jgi:hypothetical protein
MVESKGGFHKEIYTLRLQFALCAHLFCWNLLSLGIIALRLVLNLLHFLPSLGALYALRHAPNFYEIHPKISKIWMPLDIRACKQKY